MDPILDMLNDDAFSTVGLTDAINMVPNNYGRVGQLNVFPFKPVKSALVAVEIKNGVLNIIPQQPRGGPANQNQGGQRSMRFFPIPHFPLEDIITAEDLDRLRAFGSADRVVGLAELIAEKQEEMAPKHHITWEFLRNGALQGKVMDVSGAVILDLFTEFGITEKTMAFALSNATTNVNAKCRGIYRHIVKELRGDNLTYVHGLCGEEFFDDLVEHPKVREAYLNYQGMNPLRDDLSRGFKHQGIFFEEYTGEATDPEGNTKVFIPKDEARFFPMGTTQTMRTYCAPGDFLETVNTLGKPLYSKIAPDAKLNRFVELHSQSNVLPICLRPATLVRGTK
jgi:hypothetical protein